MVQRNDSLVQWRLNHLAGGLSAVSLRASRPSRLHGTAERRFAKRIVHDEASTPCVRRLHEHIGQQDDQQGDQQVDSTPAVGRATQ